MRPPQARTIWSSRSHSRASPGVRRRSWPMSRCRPSASRRPTTPSSPTTARVNKTRSAAQPFPDLRTRGSTRRAALLGASTTERRRGVGRAARTAVRRRLAARRRRASSCRRRYGRGSLRASGDDLAPKALALTLFVRLFVATCSSTASAGPLRAGHRWRHPHGTTGSSRRHSSSRRMTMYLPLGAHIVSDEEVAAAGERLNRLEHNPDRCSGRSSSIRPTARAGLALAAEKADLVAAIAAPGCRQEGAGSAHPRGQRGARRAPRAARRGTRGRARATLRDCSRGTEVLTDRTYPFCLWRLEVADKAR